MIWEFDICGSYKVMGSLVVRLVSVYDNDGNPLQMYVVAYRNLVTCIDRVSYFFIDT